MTLEAPKANLVPRWLGLIAVLAIAVVSLAAMVTLFDDPPDGLIAQGPAAVDPRIEQELAVLFQPEFVETTQRLLHVLGLTVFLGLALLLIGRRDASNRAPLAAVTLAALGASLFAPLWLLDRGDQIALFIGSITPPMLISFWGSLAGVATLAFLATFPDGKWTPSWTRWLVVAAAVSGLASFFFPGTFFDPRVWPSSLQFAWLVGLPIAAIFAQLVRSRQPDFVKTTKPIVISLVTALGAFLVLWILQPELTADVLDLIVVTPRLKAVYALNVLVLLTIAVFMFPVSVSVAIVRHRLFDLDLLVNRALVYGTVTALVGIGFLALSAGVAAVAGGVSDLTITWQGGLGGVFLGTVLVLVFQPLRTRVQRGVDRRFYRERYDARQVIDDFAGEAARLVDPATLEAELVSTVERALRPKSVQLHTGPFSKATRKALASGAAIDLEGVAPSKGLAPFSANGTAILVPLVAGGSLTGVLDLGDRASDSRYSTLDLELLDRLAQTAGPALQLAYEVQMREKDAQNKERAAHELELARKIQQGLLPHGFPEIPGWAFNAFYRPAREVGGD
ncbi:MAG TPA: hypothetical protein VI193_10265, partial [Acidimicrobiia bacterium]